MKQSDCAQEARAVVEEIRRETQKSAITIKIEYSNNNPRLRLLFEHQPGAILMK